MSDLHPELKWRAPLLRLLPTTTTRRLPLRRRLMSRMPSPKLSGVAVHDDVVSANGLHVPVRRYRPVGIAGPLPVLVWMHGGGLVLGTHVDDMPCGRLVNEHEITVVSVGYRLAPEHPYPAAIDDITAVVDWIRSQGEDRGFDVSRMAVGGQSAGGGLAAAAAQHLLDADLRLRGQLLVYPMLDDRTVARTDIEPKEHLVWNNASNDTGWTAYLGTAAGSADVPDGAVPARREDLTGLAPAWIGVGTLDLFHDENVAYAERLRAAGVGCDLHVVPGMVHGFDILVPKGEATRRFNASQDTFIQRVLTA